MKSNNIFLIFAITLLALLLPACATLSNCKSNADCTRGTMCINSKCTTLSIYKNLEESRQASAPEQKRDATLEVIELCETQNPAFNPRDECYKIRTSKYAAWRVCDYTVGPITWSNMGSCQSCIISCKAQ